MSIVEDMIAPTTLEKMIEMAVNRRRISIGLPAATNEADRRFALTPEAAGMLVERGFCVKMEAGAATGIHYADLRYQQQGVDIADRAEVFRSDIVIYLSQVTTLQARMLKRGALLLTLFDSATLSADVARLLLQNRVITLALDLVRDEQGHRPFADIIAEISGRASIAMAASLLADPAQGKGILLGGVAGIVPCEVTILGSGISACAAARSALGLGAAVRMFDNDVYRLRNAIRELGPGVQGSALHPHVLLGAMRTADVVVATPVRPNCEIGPDAVSEMKLGVVTFDLTHGARSVFPTLSRVDLCNARPGDNSMDGCRVCYVNPDNAVPRTVAMAISNSLLTMLTDLFTCDGLNNAMMLNTGLQRAALTFLGKPVNATVASLVGMRAVDIRFLLQFS